MVSLDVIGIYGISNSDLNEISTHSDILQRDWFITVERWWKHLQNLFKCFIYNLCSPAGVRLGVEAGNEDGDLMFQNGA